MLEAIPCPLCKNARTFLPVTITDEDAHIGDYGELYAGKKLSEWKICGECGFVHQNPRPTTEALNRYYQEGRYHTVAAPDLEHIVSWGPAYYGEEVDWTIAATGIRAGRVFEIGAGTGISLHCFEQRGWQCFGVEPDPTQSRFAQTRFGLTGVQTGILDANTRLPEPVDVVFSHHAFEHFADLDGVMQGIRNILRPGGYLFTAIPTYRENHSNMSRLWMNSAHYSLFTHTTFNQLLARYGFEEVTHRYDHLLRKSDQFRHLAKFTGANLDPRHYYEPAAEVDRYLRVVNPIRSAFYYPKYGAVSERIFDRARYWWGAAALMVKSPGEFYRRARARLHL